MLHYAHLGPRLLKLPILLLFAALFLLPGPSIAQEKEETNAPPADAARASSAGASTESAPPSKDDDAKATAIADSASPEADSAAAASKEGGERVLSRVEVLIGSLTIFVLAIFVGFEIINKVPPTLHTPLMSGSNAISGITIVGAIFATGFAKLGIGSFFGLAAVVLAMINVAGGFWVTHRMLAMFKKK